MRVRIGSTIYEGPECIQSNGDVYASRDHLTVNAAKRAYRYNSGGIGRSFRFWKELHPVSEERRGVLRELLLQGTDKVVVKDDNGVFTVTLKSTGPVTGDSPGDNPC